MPLDREAFSEVTDLGESDEVGEIVERHQLVGERSRCAGRFEVGPASSTHLTLPTNRDV